MLNSLRLVLGTVLVAGSVSAAPESWEVEKSYTGDFEASAHLFMQNKGAVLHLEYACGAKSLTLLKMNFAQASAVDMSGCYSTEDAVEDAAVTTGTGLLGGLAVLAVPGIGFLASGAASGIAASEVAESWDTCEGRMRMKVGTAMQVVDYEKDMGGSEYRFINRPAVEVKGAEDIALKHKDNVYRFDLSTFGQAMNVARHKICE